MSDNDDFMQDSDQEESVFPIAELNRALTSTRYDFEYEDDDEDQGGDVDIENKYYNGKGMKVEYPEEAVEEFLGVPKLEKEKGDWYAVRNPD